MSPARRRRRVIISLWSLCTLLLLALHTLFWWQQEQLRHTRTLHQLADRIASLQASADSTLENFASFLAQVDPHDIAMLRRFAHLQLQRSPHIYCLQIMEKIRHEDVAALETRMQTSGYPDFRVHSFSYNSNRTVQPLPERAVHYPVVFMEPFPPEAHSVLGLDIDANQFLAVSRADSGEIVRPLSTAPFRLIEGDIAYGMTLPAYFLHPGLEDWPLYVGLVIKSSSFAKAIGPLPTGWRLQMQYATPGSPALFDLNNPGHGLSHWLFPVIRQEIRLPSQSQPFILRSEEQLGWRDWSGPMPAMIITVMIAMLFLLLRWQISERRRQLAERRQKLQLTRWAMYDPLTLCANRQHFDRQLGQALEHKQPFVLIFLDLNEFKPVNDRLGHDFGDRVLQETGRRLRRCVRSGDLVARWGGDEFAILVRGGIDPMRQETLKQTIASEIARPFPHEDAAIGISASIGMASYPAEALDQAALLRLADQRMYASKALR